MERRIRPTTLLIVGTLFVMVVAVAADANAQLRGRRFSRHDLEEMEEYYDDLEDFYEDRNPRLAKEAERMEKYYKDLRKGRNVSPPGFSLPGLRIQVDPRFRYIEPPAPSNSTRSYPPTQRQPQPRERWQPWGAAPTPQPVPSARRTVPMQAPHPEVRHPEVTIIEGPLQGTPTPTLAPPQTSEVQGAPVTENYSNGSELRFPPTSTNTSSDPNGRLVQSHAALQRDLERLAAKSPDAASQWMEYLAVPSSDVAEMDAREFYTTGAGRERLASTLDRYDEVAGDPQFRAISHLPAFGRTRSALRRLLESLEKQPTLAEPGADSVEQIEAEELPVPPAN